VANNRSQEELKDVTVDDREEQSLLPTDAPQEAPGSHSGTVQYDVPPPVRGKTITIHFDEMVDPELDAMTDPQPGPVSCCTGAINASLELNGRRILCLGCATIYQYGFKVRQMSGVRRYTSRRPL
jgi:hypothetical protein